MLPAEWRGALAFPNELCSAWRERTVLDAGFGSRQSPLLMIMNVHPVGGVVPSRILLRPPEDLY